MSDAPVMCVDISEVRRIIYLDQHSLVQTCDGRAYVFDYDKPESGRLVNYFWWEPSRARH